MKTIVYHNIFYCTMECTMSYILFINHLEYEHKYLKKQKSQNYFEDIMLCIIVFMPKIFSKELVIQ